MVDISIRCVSKLPLVLKIKSKHEDSWKRIIVMFFLSTSIEINFTDRHNGTSSQVPEKAAGLLLAQSQPSLSQQTEDS